MSKKKSCSHVSCGFGSAPYNHAILVVCKFIMSVLNGQACPRSEGDLPCYATVFHGLMNGLT